jgi:hypothetical protein
MSALGQERTWKHGLPNVRFTSVATQYTKPEHWGHFLEMAETWEMLLRHQQERSQQTIALADRFRNVLFLSDIAPKRPPEADNDEKAA